MRPTRSPRSPLRVVFMISLVCMSVISLFNGVSEASLNLPSYLQRQSLFGPAGLEDTVLQPMKWSVDRMHYTKRDKGNSLDPYECQSLSMFERVMAKTFESLVVPYHIIDASRVIHKGVNCSSIRVDFHRNHFYPELNLLPKWIHSVERFGSCPTEYVTKDMGSNIFPSKLVEARCTCPGSRCSREGHECVAITGRIQVLERKESGCLIETKDITIACVCSSESAPLADYAHHYPLEN